MKQKNKEISFSKRERSSKPSLFIKKLSKHTTFTIMISKDLETLNMQLGGTKEPYTGGTTRTEKNATAKAIPTMHYLFATTHSVASSKKN